MAEKPAKVQPKKKVRTAVSDAGSSQDEAENRAKARKGALFLGAVVIIYVAYLVFSGQMDEFVAALGQVDLRWICGAAFCYLLYFVFGVIAYVIAVYLDHDSPVGVRDLMSVEASGVFFGNLTPMMAGSVPSQIVRLTSTGLDAGEASATQFTRFIMFQFGVVLFAALMLVAKLRFFFESFGDIVILNLVVFGVHLLELVVLFVVCLCPHFVMHVGNWGIRLARRFRVQDEALQDASQVVNVQVMEFSRAFKHAASDLPSMGLTLVVTMLQLACLYMIPWFVLRGFGLHEDFLECLAAGSMVQMVASAVPLPGGTGGAEGGFLLFYGGMFGSAASAGFLVWRIVIFFGPTFLAVPLLGLRTKNRQLSLYHRIRRRGERISSLFHPRGKARGRGSRRGGAVAAYKPKKAAAEGAAPAESSAAKKPAEKKPAGQNPAAKKPAEMKPSAQGSSAKKGGPKIKVG